MDVEEDPCEFNYEELRRKNLEDNNVILKKLMLDCEAFKSVIPVKKRKVNVQRKKPCLDECAVRRNPSRSSRKAPARFDLPYARPRSGSVSSAISSSSSSSQVSSPEKLVVRFGFCKVFSGGSSTVSSKDAPDSDGVDDEDYPLPSTKRQPRTGHVILSPEEITEAHLDAVAVFVSDKKYDSINGTTCHQCRQKTDDMKTICRSESCVGVRGQFCGTCLRNRYGEDAKLALLDPDWECPPCRGICNCSICRRRHGRSSTGILIHIARENGFTDVNAYLSGAKKTEAQK